MSVLIDVPTLAGLLESGSAVTLLDVRWTLAGGVATEDYLAGHLPGAQLVDLDADLAAPPGVRGRHPLPDRDCFAAAMRRLGVRGGVPAVCYDGGDASAAARAWWLLRSYGHPDVRVLDGGYVAWVADGQAVQSGVTVAAPGDFEAGPGPIEVVEVEDVLGYVTTGTLLDARDAVRYRGEFEPIDAVAGHIPGAVNAPTKQNVGPDGRFLDPAVLRSRFAQIGVTENEPLAVYCGSGVTATHEILALAVAGYPAALYPGSWSEWITDPNRPIA